VAFAEDRRFAGFQFLRAHRVIACEQVPGCPPLAANNGVVGKDGTVYIPQTCTGGTYLAVSADEGASYAWRRVVGAPSASGLGAVVQLAIDRAGNLYFLWTEADALRLLTSRDGGASWRAPLTVSAPGCITSRCPA
jgi:hypothetical protein